MTCRVNVEQHWWRHRTLAVGKPWRTRQDSTEGGRRLVFYTETHFLNFFSGKAAELLDVDDRAGRNTTKKFLHWPPQLPRLWLIRLWLAAPKLGTLLITKLAIHVCASLSMSCLLSCSGGLGDGVGRKLVGPAARSSRRTFESTRKPLRLPTFVVKPRVRWAWSASELVDWKWLIYQRVDLVVIQRRHVVDVCRPCVG